ncbi:LCP family protein [Streptomyces ficellus]|uniref:LCP family protein n=1 Tax=Streptomyces ficellus TaxID=1977088 RepID=A0ABT7Z106_9ACTN|nr:LCP family protein [Streptomyces ficellus]MDN3293177.1 LCP family protein [Streptomyces ficellus]
MTDSAGTPPEPDPPSGASGPGSPAGDAASEQSGPPAPGNARTPSGGKRGKRVKSTQSSKGIKSSRTAKNGRSGRKRARTATKESRRVSSTRTPAPRPTRQDLRRFRPRWLRAAAFAGAVVVLGAAGTGWWLYQKLDGNITTDTSAATELERYAKERPASLVRGARNILLIGSDTRAGSGNAQYGRDKGTQRSDTTILLHLAAHGRGVTAVSVPRDLMVRVPSCRKRDGTRTAAQFAQFNSAFELGGTACTIRTVEKLTGIRVDHHVVIDFRGFKDMVNAVGGVRVCVSKPIHDPDAKLNLKAGARTLNGEQALGYVRARKSLGDGSDTERMERQQQFLAALVNKVHSNGVLLNPARLYPVLDAATKSLTTDPGLDSLKDLYDLSRAMRSVPTEKVQFLTVPRRPYSGNPNRDELVQPSANSLFKRLRDDEPVVVVPGDGQPESGGEEPGAPSGQRGDASPSAAPTFAGTNAAVGTCR